MGIRYAAAASSVPCTFACAAGRPIGFVDASRSQRDEKRQCPFCRHPCQANAVAHASTTVLTGLLEKYFAEETAARATEANVERRDYRRRLPLFLSQTVDFPVRDVTYFMFEPR